MLLSDYEWSRNPRGLHVQRILITPLQIERWVRPHFGWVKLIAAGGEYLDDSQFFLERYITPVLRPYRARFGASPMDRSMRDQILAYSRVGVKWFEFYNEPNLGIEWHDGFDPDWHDVEGIIRPLMENWLVWAEYVVSLGCYPGFPALAESADVERYAAVRWMDAFLLYLAEHRYDRFRNVLAGGLYCATHPYILNHYYQETPNGGPFSARPPDAQNAQEGGWHFEYPYDPISLRHDPGRTVYGGTELTPNGDPNGLIAMGRMFNERCGEIFGSQAVPVVGTEGGIWPFRNGTEQPDNRYPPYNELSQAEATVAMFEWITNRAPAWFFGVCLWKEDEYYFNGTTAPAIERLALIPPLARVVPSIFVMVDGFEPVPLDAEGHAIRGPGPIQGQADYHMFIVPVGMETDWFFDTAQSYWNAFRPIITSRIDIIDLIPHTSSFAVTVISPPEFIDDLTERIQQRYPNIWFDLIIAEDIAEVQTLLNGRVLENRRFG